MNTIGVLIISLSLLIISVSSAVAPAPTTTKVDCSTLVISMVDCLSFVSANSTVMKPAGTCCAGLKSVMKASPNCICEAFANSAQLGVSLNITKAMTLPTICHVASPLDNCKVSHGNIAPVTSPKGAMSPKAASDKPTTAEEPTKAAPTASSKKNSGSSLAASTGAVLVLAIALISVA